MDTPIHILVFDALGFIRQNNKVYRKYIFLPILFSIAGIFLEQIPYFGLTLSTLADSVAVALVSVSSIRFYLLRDADRVAAGANEPFARFFFVTFMLTAFGHMGQVFESQSALFGLFLFMMIFAAWLNLKLSLAFPALAMSHPGSVVDNLRASFDWTRGMIFKLIAVFMLCYSPVVFFVMVIMRTKAFTPVEDPSFWTGLPQLLFSNILILFSMMWTSVVTARLYELVVLKKKDM